MQNVEEFVIAQDDEGGPTGEEFVIRSARADKKHSLSGLPNYAIDRRADLGAARDFIGTFDGWDYAQTIRDNAKARIYEYLAVDLRLNGRVNGPTKLIHLKQRTETVEFSASSETSGGIGARLAQVERAVYAGERPRNRARRHALAPPQVNPLDVARMVAETAERSAEQERKRQADFRAEMREEIAARMPKENPAPTPAPASDPTESFLNTYEKFLDISARINPNGEAHSGWLDKLTGVVESVARVAASPTVHAIVARVLMPPATAGGQAAPMYAPPQATAPHLASVPQAETPSQEIEEEEETAESAANAVLSDACTDLLNNEDVGQSAKDITRLLEDWPEIVPRFEPLFALSSPELQQALALLAGEAGPQIMTAPHAVEWLNKLKTAIALRRGPVLVAPSSNGNGSKAA
jgi:hypothetical protein